MVRFQATGVGDLGFWGMSQDEPAAFLLVLSSKLLRPTRPTGWSLGFGPRSLFLRLVCPCQVRCEMVAELVSCSTKLVEHCLVRLESC